MSMFKKLLTGLSLLAVLAGGARADLVDLGVFVLPSALGNPADEAAWIETELGLVPGSLDYLYKTDSADGALDESYFNVEAGNPTAEVSWDLTGTGYELNYVLAKDGRGTYQDVTGFLYHLYGVTDWQYVIGDSSNLDGGVIEIDGEKEISHISFFGGSGTTVPDGGTTAVLLGLSLVAISFVARRRAA